MTDRSLSSVGGQSEADAWRSLDLVLAWLSELVGFRVASVNVVRGGDQLQVIALSGVERGVTMDGVVQLADQMLGTTWPVEELLRALDVADDWGRFKFIPHDRVLDSPSGWLVPSTTHVEGPDAWHEEDALVAPLYDDEGTLIGTLSVDDPRDGRRPPPAMHHLLDEYAGHVNLSLLNALQRSQLADRARILDETRTLVRLLSEAPDTSLASTHARIRQAFNADDLLIHTFGETEDDPSSVIPPHAGYAVETAMLADRAREAWEGGTAYSATVEEFLETLEAGHERETAATWMRANGIGSMLFAPVGAGAECLGSIVISRQPGRAAWTEQHLEAAREFAQDLGRVLHARRVLHQEQRLVAAQRDLEHAKSRLIAAVSRELTMPLDAISSIAGTLDPTALDHRSLRALYREAHRVGRVIDDLLLLSRLSDPDAAVPDGTLDLAAVAQRTVGVVSAARGAEVSLRVSTASPEVPVRGSAGEVERALVRLVTYALMFAAPDTPASIRITERGSNAHVVVAGGGDITATHPLRERALTDLDGGELALAIADRAVRRHGGHLEIAEGPQSVSFRMTLPLLRSQLPGS